ncbi:hypothetical protein [uncultured Marinobacter sp.]|uniref:hypothetical protein n=1 Tax=uncultured Marinobacter sp. TaxID=187379 RepID=UPI002627C310|nr:hypothetical protein [uncultured Marinobacter sp.]
MFLQRRPVTVVPMALSGPWGSFFSHCRGPALSHLPKRFWSRIELAAGEPVSAEKANAEMLEQRVKGLSGSGQ